MKHALTAGGTLPIWFVSAKNALLKMNIPVRENRAIYQLRGRHPQHGAITIILSEPSEGKVRMTIDVEQPELLQTFKKTVISEFKAATQKPLSEQRPNVSADTQPHSEAEQINTRQEKEAVPVENNDNLTSPVIKVTAPIDFESIQKKLTELDQDDLFGETASDLLTNNHTDQNEATSDFPTNDNTDQSEIPSDPEKTSDEEAHDKDKAPVKTKICPSCKNTIDKKAKVCPHCEKKQTNTNLLIGICLGIFLLIAIAGCIYFSRKTSTPNQPSDPETTAPAPEASNETQVTLAQFEQIKPEMTYAEVCTIFGSNGSMIGENTIQDENGGNISVKQYYWTGKGAEDAVILITFQNDLVVDADKYGSIE